MLPREHGAYGQLLFPLVTALALGRPGAAALALAAAAIAAFLAHEPLLVLLGQRGTRAARERGPEARHWFTGLAAMAAIAGAAGVRLAPQAARVARAAP
ncbi:MAG: YwiC-like family protein, partial [Acidobacteriota bacterium]|nr:YwiC-like family protein [Acidobacteriota bacterium]